MPRNCALYEGNSWAFRDKDKSTLPPIFDLEGVPKKGQDSYGCGICVAPAGGREGDNAGAQAGTSGNDKFKHYNNIATNFLQELVGVGQSSSGITQIKCLKGLICLEWLSRVKF